MNRGWHVYETFPIDFDWGHLPSVDDVAQKLGGIEAIMRAAGDENYIEGTSLDSFLDAWENAKAAARDHGWEGDFRAGPVVMWIPEKERGGFRPGFVFKQDNNGSTFVISPVELPHLQ